MDKRQEEAFWETIKVLDELAIIGHVMIIGSWAEYLYPPLFESKFIPNIRTRDVDFFYKNINVPREKIPFIKKMAEYGFVYAEDPYTEVSKFYKEDLLELEFLTRVMGSGAKSTYLIRALGIKSEGLRVVNILADFAVEVERNGYKLLVPEPSVYVIQKLLTNSTRVPQSKKQKDIMAIEELLVHIKQSEYHRNKLQEIYKILTKKQLETMQKVLEENFIELF